MLLQGLLLAVVVPMSLACKSLLEYRIQCQSCVSDLVKTWKNSPGDNCSLQYKGYKECLTKAKDKCLVQDPKIQAQIQMVHDDFSSNETFFCQDGMLSSFTVNELLSLRTICSPKLHIKAAKCHRKYKERFGKNKASKALCKWFYKARKCMVKVLQRTCKPSKLREQLEARYNYPYNPFCGAGRDYVKKETRGDPGFGQCTQKSYTIKSRQCIVSFIQRLQINNGKQCRAIVDAVLTPCIKSRIRRCLRGTRDAKSLDNELKRSMDNRRTLLQNQYCEGGYLETLPLSSEQCSAEYFETFQQRCYSKFIIEYKKNRGNPKLCQYYAEVNRCARNMTMSMCTMDESMKDAVNFLYDSFNPFCPDGKDPPISSRHPSYGKRKTSLKNRGITHAFSALLLVLSITVTLASL